MLLILEPCNLTKIKWNRWNKNRCKGIENLQKSDIYFDHLVDLEKCCKMSIWRKKSALIQPRTSPPKFVFIRLNFVFIGSLSGGRTGTCRGRWGSAERARCASRASECAPRSSSRTSCSRTSSRTLTECTWNRGPRLSLPDAALRVETSAISCTAADAVGAIML